MNFNKFYNFRISINENSNDILVTNLYQIEQVKWLKYRVRTDILNFIPFYYVLDTPKLVNY